MLRFYDFRCTNNHVFEDFVDETVRTSRCKCGADAKRIITPVHFHLDGSDPSWPTAASKWEREHEAAGRKSKSGDNSTSN